MDVRPRHWGIALCTAIALHGSVLIAALVPSNAGTPSAGIGGIEVSLGPAGAAQGSATAVTETESVAPVKTPVAEAVAAMPEELSPQPVETVVETTPVAPEPMAEPVEAPAAVAEVAPLPDVPPEKPRAPVQVAAVPAPPQASPHPIPAPPALQTAALSGDTGQGGNTKFDAAGIGNATSGGGQPGDPGYNALLSAWLQQHHEFPARAQRRKMYGETTVRFTIDRSGNLLDSKVVDSSGYKLLDEAALATVKRASPLPPMPAEMPGSEYNPIITLRFTPPT